MSPSASDIIQQFDSVTAESFGDDDAARKAAFRAADKLTRRLEKPWDAIARWTWETPFIFGAIATAVDLDIFTHLSAIQDGQTTSLAGLAATTKAHPDLLARLCRALASVDYIAQPNATTLAPTPLTRMAATREAAGALRWGAACAYRVAPHIPATLAAQHYTPTSDPTAAPLGSAFGTDAPYFAWLNAQPELLADFSAFMRGQSRQHDDWTALLARPTALLNGAPLDQDGAPLFIDVGGGTGHDAAVMRTHVLAAAAAGVEGGAAAVEEVLRGRFIVQDQPDVVALGAEPGVTYAVHDFFQVQPVHGARVYFMKHILHDWPDEQAIAILETLAPAMRRGFSRVVVAERVVPDVGAHAPAVGMDFCMMGLLSAKERTARDWEALFARAGMRIVETHRSPVHEQAVLEIELAH